MNKLDLMGRFVATPDFSVTGKGKDQKAICKFRLAVRNFTKEEADFFNCTAFGRVAEIVAEHGDKGLRIALSGRIVNNNWDDKDGNTHYGFEVIVNDVFLIDSAQDDGRNSKNKNRK